jgi:hypothetical protein
MLSVASHARPRSAAASSITPRTPDLSGRRRSRPRPDVLEHARGRALRHPQDPASGARPLQIVRDRQTVHDVADPGEQDDRDPARAAQVDGVRRAAQRRAQTSATGAAGGAVWRP